jgi:hypothetical protein
MSLRLWRSGDKTPRIPNLGTRYKCDELHASADLHPRKSPPEPIRQEVPEAVCTGWLNKNCATGNRTAVILPVVNFTTPAYGKQLGPPGNWVKCYVTVR